MNEFSKHEERCAEQIADQLRELAASVVKKYAQPGDQCAAAVALLQLVSEKISTTEKR